MLVIPFADNFLAGAIISLVLPAGLLVAVVLWYHLTVRRFPAPPRSTPRGATPDNPSRRGSAVTVSSTSRFAQCLRLTTRASPELIEQRLRLPQIRRVKAFGEPAVDRREQAARLSPPALVTSVPG